MSATELSRMQSTVKTFRAPHRFCNRMHLVRLISACIVMAFGAAGFAQDETKVKAGLDVWKTAGCAECHGAFADGERQRDEAPAGANLRQTRLDDAAIAETVRCGREGTGMPRFRRGRLYTTRLLWAASRTCAGRSLSGCAPAQSAGDRRRRGVSACARRGAPRGHAGGVQLLLRRGCGCFLRRSKRGQMISASRLRDECCYQASSHP